MDRLIRFDTEYDLIYKEILKDSVELKLIDKAYKFGVATVINELHKWCDRLEESNVKLGADSIRNSFSGYLTDDDVKKYFERLQSESK